MKDTRPSDPQRPRGPRLRAWRILQEREVYDAAPFFRVLRQQVRLPDGRVVDDYHQIQFPHYVTVVARTNDHRYVMVRKYNHGYRKTCLLFPGGLINAGETPRRAAARELLEETGYAARRWNCLGHFMPHSNYGCGQVHLFLAGDCRYRAAPKSGDLEEMEICLLSDRETRRYMRSGKNPSLASMAAFLLTLEHLGGEDSASRGGAPVLLRRR